MSREFDKIFKDVKSFQIQGATVVTRIIIDALLKDKNEIIKQSKSKEDFIVEIRNIAKKLLLMKPSETMAQNVLGFILFELQDLKVKSVEDCSKIVINKTDEFKKTIKENEKSFVKNGAKIVKSFTKKYRPLNIFTHCHSSGVRNILRSVTGGKDSIDLKVFSTETRPVFQGRVTAKKMVDDNIDVTMIMDSAAPFVISKKSGSELDIDLVLMGSDAITINGVSINKVGSYGIAVSAQYEKIPLYIVTSVLKIKKGFYDIMDIPVEKESYKNLWMESPKGLNIVNFAFDMVPPEFITGFITEFGVVKPEEIKDIIKENYPRLL
ncbi:MAG: hypothetical protein U9N04_01690 [Patescibacteria group bacterium]|nr:hypothetical protein [Patescibacteria group bacterium]